jgi:hypothetical protein
MSLRARIITVVALIIFLLALNVLASRLYLYWTYTWFDKFMHGFGGILAGGVGMIFLEKAKPSNQTKNIAGNNKYDYLIAALTAGIIIGIGWEIFEFVFGISHYGPEFVSDTVTDVLMDIAGALLSYIIWFCIPMKKKVTEIQ